MERWFEFTASQEEVSCCLDPLRVRSYFLGSVAPDVRQEFLDSAIPQLESLLANCRERLETYRLGGDKFSELAMRGAVTETEARLKWMREVAAKVR